MSLKYLRLFTTIHILKQNAIRRPMPQNLRHAEDENQIHFTFFTPRVSEVDSYHLY